MISLHEDHAQQFLKSHVAATLATVDEHGQPYTSTIYYAPETENILRFITKTETSKYKNLVADDRCAITILDAIKPIALNMVGTARVLPGQTDHDAIMQEIMEIAQQQLGDYAPIVKMHSGSFVAMEFIATHGTLNDFTQRMGNVNTESHDY